MRIFALVSIAALAAALPATSAQAQQRGRAGHSWGQPRPGGPAMGAPQGPVMHGPMMPGPVMHGPMAGGPRMDRGDYYRSRVHNFERIGRGHVVPRRWWGPQFQVRNWQMYGFPQPMPGYRWVRYYDDALLIDDRGMVRDGRFDLDWDRYGDRWVEDEGGIPVYAGDEDYGYAEEHGSRGGWDYSEYEGERGPPPPPRCGPCGAPAYGYAAPMPAYGYGYGYAYAYAPATVTITETTVTTGGGYSEEVIEEYAEQAVRHRARRVHRAAPVRRPIRGERG